MHVPEARGVKGRVRWHVGILVHLCVMANVKTVVVQLRELNRLIELQLSENDTRTERDILISRIKDEFGGRIDSDDHITLQMQCKIEKFKGLFLDYFDDSIEDGSIFKIVLEKKKVCYRQNIGKGQIMYKFQVFNHLIGR